MKRATMRMLLTLLVCLPGAVFAQGRGKDHGNKPAQGHTQKQHTAKGSQQQTQRSTGKAQAQTRRSGQQKVENRRVASQKIERQQGGRSVEKRKVTSAKVERSKTEIARGKVRGDFERNVRIVSRSFKGRSARERAAIAAISHAGSHGVRTDAFVVTSIGDRVRVKNRSGRMLLDMDEHRARNMGYWDVRPLSYDVVGSAPSFCRSGAGHPVWGRQWCIDKGFGLARYRDLRWGRAATIGDVYFAPRYYTTGNLVGDVLLNVIGAVAYDRLALHAISLGYTDPINGVWVGEPYGPRVLQLYSAGYPVAEIVDADRNDRADVLVVALRL